MRLPFHKTAGSKGRRAHLFFLTCLMFTLLFSFTAMAAEEGWVEKKGEWYYYENGEPYVSRWLKIFNQAPESPEDTDTVEFYWYYFDEDGKMVSNRWKTIGDQKYRFNEDGAMEHGWFNDDYYLGGPDDGALKYGWQLIETDEEADQEFMQNHPEDVSAAGNKMLWYYFRDNGKAIKDEVVKLYGRTYRFDSDGASDRFAYETYD